MASTAVLWHGPDRGHNTGGRLTEFANPVHLLFTLDPTKADDPCLVDLALRGIDIIEWFVRLIGCSLVARSIPVRRRRPPVYWRILHLACRGRLSPICF